MRVKSILELSQVTQFVLPNLIDATGFHFVFLLLFTTYLKSWSFRIWKSENTTEVMKVKMKLQCTRVHLLSHEMFLSAGILFESTIPPKYERIWVWVMNLTSASGQWRVGEFSPIQNFELRARRYLYLSKTKNRLRVGEGHPSSS